MSREGGFRLRREGAADVDALGLVDLARRRRRQPSSRRARVLLDAGPIKHGELARLLDLRGGRHCYCFSACNCGCAPRALSARFRCVGSAAATGHPHAYSVHKVLVELVN